MKILLTGAQQRGNKLWTQQIHAGQIVVMELKGYSRPTCNKLCASSHDALNRRKVQFIGSTVDEFCYRLAVAKFSKSTVWDKVPEGSNLISGRILICL